jgi:S-adenosylmethionine uptake transporter
MFAMMLVSCANDVIVKFMGQRLDTLQVLFCRFFFSLLTLLPFVVAKGTQVFRTKQIGFNIARGILGATSFFLYIYSVMTLPLVEVVTILWTIPLFAIILSTLLLNEIVSPMQLLATLAGFFGLSAITLYDSNSTFSLKLAYLAPIASSLLFALQDVMIKRIVNRESRTTMLLYFALVTSGLTLVPALMVWVPLTSRECCLLFILGIGGNAIQYLIFKAFCATSLSALAPFRYLEFLFSAFFAFLFFGEIPGVNVFLGAAILVPCTLYLATNEREKGNSNEKNTLRHHLKRSKG